jgi:hypothetical protein
LLWNRYRRYKRFMKARAIFLVWAALAAFSVQVHAQYKSFILGGTGFPATTNLVVDAGVAVQAYRTPYPVQLWLPSQPGGQQFTQKDSFDFSVGQIIVGPAMLTLNNGFFGDSVVFTFRFIPQPDPFTPSNAVIIPADAKGPVSIIMESSTNLVDWIQALPGTYGTSSQQRYFRVRAVQQ